MNVVATLAQGSWGKIEQSLCTGVRAMIIFACNSPSRSATHILQTQWIPSRLVRLAFCLKRFAYFDDYYQQIHVFLFLTRYLDEKPKIKRLLWVNKNSRRDSEVASIVMQITSVLLA